MAIKDELLTSQPFNLKTRLGIALVLSSMGFSDEVFGFMQRASHQTRAYYVNINGFKGFLAPYSITKDLKIAE